MRFLLVALLFLPGCAHKFEWGLEPAGMTEAEKFNVDTRFNRHEQMLKAIMISVKEIRDDHGMNEVEHEKDS